MVARVNTVTFQGVEVQNVDVQVQIANGLPAFSIVGLPDKAVAESKERVRAALHSLGISLPPKRLTVNLAPADIAKEGSHYDLPIALGVLAAMEILPKDGLEDCVVLGELSLDGSIRAINGVLPAALHASANDNRLICPKACGTEASWAGDLDIIAPIDLLQLINHLKGTQILMRPDIAPDQVQSFTGPDLSEVRGQAIAKRGLEIAAAGGHNLLMIGPPGSGKSMLASCLPGILPPMDAGEALETSMIHSLSGCLPDGGLIRTRPFRDPHHSASMPAIIGGGHKARPGEISLAHNGVLFLDELPEFSRQTLESLRQPLETGDTLISRANHHVKYPARFQLIAAMNPCKCGYFGNPDHSCSRAPRCARDYQAKISGPLLDRIDIHVDVPPVPIAQLHNKRDETAESSAQVAKRVQKARQIQCERFYALNNKMNTDEKFALLNAYVLGDALDRIAPLDNEAQNVFRIAAEKMKLSARSYYRILKVARTIADLDNCAEAIKKRHIMEALGYRNVNYMA